MIRTWRSYEMLEQQDFRKKLLQYASLFNTYAFLDSCNNTVYGETTFDFLLAAGCSDYVIGEPGNTFEKLKHFHANINDWSFGYVGYDVKNEIEALTSENPDMLTFPELLFFIPENILIVKNNILQIGSLYKSPEIIYNEILNMQSEAVQHNDLSAFQFSPRMSKEDYIKIVSILKQHIIDGDIYEINFCQEFYNDNIAIQPELVFMHLCEKAKAPFSVLYKWEDKYLISASPERFLRKSGNTITSQPMKGTMKRGKTIEQDNVLKDALRNSEKEKAENIMIVDLVRNDLSKIAKTGTIKVEELFGIYSFQNVHQMVSTISAEIKNDLSTSDIIKSTFPMGSMTGAPKVRAMQLIEQYETSKRGLYSGAFGYIKPNMDFDFNVVIRSILYDAERKYISAQVGSAIVFDSLPEEEYAECLLKLKGLIQAIQYS